MKNRDTQFFARRREAEQDGTVQQEVSAIQTAVEKVTQNYLETLEALSTVYDAAAGLAQLFDSSSIAYFTLRRILESLEVGCGAIYLESGGVLRFEFEAEGARDFLKEDRIEDASLDGRALFCNGSSAIHYLRPEAGSRNVLLAPVVAAQRRLGIVVVFSDRQRPFTTKDLKLVGAVTSQAAIALSGAQHLDQSLIERQKLRSVIEDNGGGIVVLSPDGRTMLTNAVARQLLGLPQDRSEGFSLLDELSGWKFSRERETLIGDGPTELSLEMATGSAASGRMISVVGRRVRGTDGSLASIVLTLQDATEKRRGEKMKEDFLSLLSVAFQAPIESLRDTLRGGGADGDGEPDGLADGLGPVLEELLGLSERLRCYVEVLDGSWAGAGSADLTGIVSQTRDRLVQRFAPRSPQVELDLDPTAGEVGISSEAAGMIVGNLLENAVEFGPEQQPQVRVVTQRASAAWITFTLEDRLPQKLVGVQQRFLRGLENCEEDVLLDSRQLTIRLALVQEAVHRIGGKIEARPAAGQGTLLTVTLPATGGRPAPVEPQIRGASPSRRRPELPIGGERPGGSSGPYPGEPGAPR